MKVFLSYDSQNFDSAELLKAKLEAAGINVWKDSINIDAGTSWRDEIDRALEASDAVIVLLTPESAASSYVTYEWAFALGCRKTVIPLMTKTCEVHPRMSAIHHMDFTGREKPWDKLIDRLNKVQVTKNDVRMGDLTVSEVLEIFAQSQQLVQEKSKSEERSLQREEVANTATAIVNAKTNFTVEPGRQNIILWVDDRPDNNIQERRALESVGFRFELALSTREAISKFSKNKYVAIISDMGRREGPTEGYVLLKKIREIDKDIPYFIYAGSNAIEHKREAQQKGAQGSTNRVWELIDLITAHARPAPRNAPTA